jgi:hypothetical protein
MRETPEQFVARPAGTRYPADDLARYRYHTGAVLRPLTADEPCPVLFRDLGLLATARFLRGELRRLAGPLTPLTYVRTDGYVEPYTDHEHIGRLIFLRPLLLAPWHAGVPHVYVARATRAVDPGTVGFVPGHIPLAEAGRRCADLRNTGELRETLGGCLHDEAALDTLHRLEVLATEQEVTEERAGPLRRAFQSHDCHCRERASEEMQRLGITENNLCAAWHHLPRERRAFLSEALAELDPALFIPSARSNAHDNGR